MDKIYKSICIVVCFLSFWQKNAKDPEDPEQAVLETSRTKKKGLFKKKEIQNSLYFCFKYNFSNIAFCWRYFLFGTKKVRILRNHIENSSK